MGHEVSIINLPREQNITLTEDLIEISHINMYRITTIDNIVKITVSAMEQWGKEVCRSWEKNGHEEGYLGSGNRQIF